ncbi:hypothetical protein SPSIL_014780 [Sporomusa silvacetica DSM 10669]|uniref:Arc-like DNA binding domain-containing protein n=1 Tax=Sporomusa silvacetica DSM 10669 TaxID=1123289 RepID=A0ABZ3IJ41_9FIRM|nr:Arc family DNA-binding protein [Sporomusa silvacetica]OZC21540.1 hypothetical protein SPSIL_09510 [Sporomusa silvacetica DSM 10669]
MPSDLPRIPIRASEETKNKMEYIAFKNGRSLNKEVIQLLNRYIEQFEKRNGEILFDHYCERLSRSVVVENGHCFLIEKCNCGDCQQHGGDGVYMRKC